MDEIKLTTEDEFIVFAALLAMVDDIHVVQDAMTKEQWDRAEELKEVLQQRIDERRLADKAHC